MKSSILLRSTLVLGAAVALLGAGCGTNTSSTPAVPSPTPSAPVTNPTPEAPTSSAPVVPAATTTTPATVPTQPPQLPQDQQPQSTPAPAPTPSRPAPTAKTYSLQDVAQHKDASSCWTVVSGKVYDVTSWIARHPGGERAILSMCGRDATSAFSGQHGGQARPESELASYQIGTAK